MSAQGNGSALSAAPDIALASVTATGSSRDRVSDPDLANRPHFERRTVAGRENEVRIRRVTGFDRRRGGFPSRLSEQCRQALMNGSDSLAAAGLSMQDVVRVVYLVRDADAFPACFPLLRDAFGDARPAATLRLVCDFDVPDVKIELELIARPQLHADHRA
ncbi:Rid family hydrolase [Rhizosaccharibacter radicis]|uniref:Rid family hydrolase n=1 Tax=Rhizosaccharibacter radicis TaxID=2782605 RepID=A0ABT1VSX8_9PROT|nr:Rid family hydrolase [Acetobacteraceae bacterium KSS12]